MQLSDLLVVAAHEPALGEIGGKNSVLAVAENARALIISALSARSPKTTLIVATPTGTGAQQLHDDLVQFLGAQNALLFPAWETLPFERVSPSVETMGRRMEVLWRMRGTDRPRVVVGSVRALLQKLGPNATTFEPIIVRPGAELDADELLKQLVNGGYRREELVEHRGEIARRGSIIDIFPSTSNTPVRIDLWGDEVDRLTSFNVNDQRSTEPLSEAAIFAARELQLDDEVMDRARSLVATESWGREHWDRLADGGNFDGMESWLPWLIEKDLLLTDVLQDDCELMLVEPRRMRDRAHDLLAEEDDLARALASTWARDAEKNISSPPRRNRQTAWLHNNVASHFVVASSRDHRCPFSAIHCLGPDYWRCAGNSQTSSTIVVRQMDDCYRRRRYWLCRSTERGFLSRRRDSRSDCCAVALRHVAAKLQAVNHC